MENKFIDKKPTEKFKLLDTTLKVFKWAGIIIGAAIVLVVLYQILKYLFVGALLFIAWLCPKGWK